MTGVAAPVPADLIVLKELIEAGTLRNVIGRSYPLSEIAEAHRYAQSGHKVGNSRSSSPTRRPAVALQVSAELS